MFAKVSGQPFSPRELVIVREYVILGGFFLCSIHLRPDVRLIFVLPSVNNQNSSERIAVSFS